MTWSSNRLEGVKDIVLFDYPTEEQRLLLSINECSNSVHGQAQVRQCLLQLLEGYLAFTSLGLFVVKVLGSKSRTLRLQHNIISRNKSDLRGVRSKQFSMGRDLQNEMVLSIKAYHSKFCAFASRSLESISCI